MLAVVAATGLAYLLLRGRVLREGPAAHLKSILVLDQQVPDSDSLDDDAAKLKLQASNDELLALYERMATGFKSGGLDTAGIAALIPWFHGVEDDSSSRASANSSLPSSSTGSASDLASSGKGGSGGDAGGSGGGSSSSSSKSGSKSSMSSSNSSAAVTAPWPRRYVDFPEPLPENAVRILVVPLDASPDLAAAATAITREVVKLLPNTTKWFANQRTHYHCTLFHPSHPVDPRPDPTRPDGGLPDLKSKPSERRPPTQQELEHEDEVMRGIVAGQAPPIIQLDRVVMANSGTLLVTWTDANGGVSRVRQACRAAFPGAPTRQASIVHTSLMRIVTPRQLDRATIDAVQAVCDKWTDKLRGRTYTPSNGLWFVRESEFSTIVGEREVLPLAGQKAGRHL